MKRFIEANEVLNPEEKSFISKLINQGIYKSLLEKYSSRYSIIIGYISPEDDREVVESLENKGILQIEGPFYSTPYNFIED